MGSAAFACGSTDIQDVYEIVCEAVETVETPSGASEDKSTSDFDPPGPRSDTAEAFVIDFYEPHVRFLAPSEVHCASTTIEHICQTRVSERRSIQHDSHSEGTSIRFVFSKYQEKVQCKQ